jgi:acylphosphatase
MAPSETVRAYLLVRGRVQGVFFRGSMCDEARRFGVRGWVRNQPDGSVDAVAEGSRAAVDRLIIWAHTGPPGALVTNVEVRWEPARGELTEFSIRR